MPTDIFPAIVDQRRHHIEGHGSRNRKRHLGAEDLFSARLMATGIEPPVVVQYSASAVPVLQISLSSDNLSQTQLYDYGIYRLRQMLAPIHGITLPTPAGGKYRQIMVDIVAATTLIRALIGS
jgi:hypothetical protein